MSQPVNGTTFRFLAQPVTLTIINAAKTGQAALTYSVEVATDPAFVNKVLTKDGIAEGSGGTPFHDTGPTARRLNVVKYGGSRGFGRLGSRVRSCDLLWRTS